MQTMQSWLVGKSFNEFEPKSNLLTEFFLPEEIIPFLLVTSISDCTNCPPRRTHIIEGNQITQKSTHLNVNII
jgi:hypothetical protein